MDRWLTPLGYPVTQARTAEAALVAAGVTHPGVAICDVGLPGGHDGLWLIDRMRRDHPNTALILATGQESLPAAATLREGVVSYLLKPFGRDQLRAAVLAAVRWHEDVTSDQSVELALERAARQCRRDLRARLQGRPIATETDALHALELLFPDRAERERGVRVSITADTLADQCSMSAGERAALHWAARFHQVCRLTIPGVLLEKPEALSHAEAAIVQRAPSEAFEVLLDHPFLADAGYVLRSIREREDGLGHPDGLVGAAIPVGSRILAVAEAIEAITHDQPHRPARSPADAVLELLRCAGTQFDAHVVHLAVEIMARH
jgi:response regulator RpfG family c-di-GMP phosphodiesterase